MEFEIEQLKHLFDLAKVKSSPEEMEKLLKNIQSILHHVHQLNDVDTRGVDPCVHVNLGLKIELGEDVEGELMHHDELMQNAPDAVGGMVRVPPILNP